MGCRIQGVRDPVGHTAENAARIGHDAGQTVRSRLDPSQIHLEDLAQHPHAVEVAHGKELNFGSPGILTLHLGAGVHIAGDHFAVDGGAQGVGLVRVVSRVAAQDAGLLFRTIQLGFGLAVGRLRAFEIALRTGVEAEEFRLAVSFLLGRAKVSLCLGQIGIRRRYVRRLDLRQ